MKRCARDKQQGFNLIETAIVLGVIGLVIGGVWTAASAVRSSLKISSAARDILLLTANAQKAFPARLSSAGTSGSCSGYSDLAGTAMAAGIIPAGWIVNGSLTPPIGSTVWLIQWGQGEMGGVAHDVDVSGAVSLVLAGLSYEECRRLLPAALGAARQNSLFLYIDVGTAGTGALCDWGSVITYKTPITPDISQSCSTTSTNKVQFMLQPG